mgnify:FL=1
MQQEQEKLKHRLDEELRHITFTKQVRVLKRTHPKTFREKFSIWWNKEIELPLRYLGIVMICFLLIGTYSIFEVNKEEEIDGQRVLVEEGGNYYWKDQLERAVTKHES